MDFTEQLRVIARFKNCTRSQALFLKDKYTYSEVKRMKVILESKGVSV